MGKRKICRIVKYSTLITSVSSFAIGMIPSFIGDVNVPAAVVGTSVCTVAGIASIISNNILYRYNKREELLDKQKESELYKKNMEKDMEKFEMFGMFVLSKMRNYDDEKRSEIINDYDIDMEILEKKMELLKEDDEESIDELYERIDYLSSFIKSEEYIDLKEQFYKVNNNSVVNFKVPNQETKKERNILLFINKKNKTSNDDKE